MMDEFPINDLFKMFLVGNRRKHKIFTFGNWGNFNSCNGTTNSRNSRVEAHVEANMETNLETYESGAK